MRIYTNYPVFNATNEYIQGKILSDYERRFGMVADTWFKRYPDDYVGLRDHRIYSSAELILLYEES